MQLFLRELKSHRKSLFFWSIGMAALVASGLAKFAAYQTSGTSISGLLNQFPKSIQIIFGINGFDLTRAQGYYGVLYLYIALMVAVHAVLLGAEIVSKEERDKTAEFLLVRPIARSSILNAKIFAGFCSLVVLNFVTLLSSLVFISYYNKGDPLTHIVLLFMTGILFIQIIFFAIGIAIAAIRTKPKASATIASSILLITLIISYAIDLNSNLSATKYLTPFKYFDAKIILQSNSIDPAFVILSIAIVTVLLFLSYSRYTKRDIDC